MPSFQYTAIDKAGKQKSGKIQAASDTEARAKISSQGLMVTKVFADTKQAKKQHVKERKGGGGGINFGPVISEEGITVFTRQIATLLNSGLPLVRALEVMIRQEDNPRFKQVLVSLSETVQSGSNLSDGLVQHPKIFDKLFVNMVRAGEAGGVLEVVLSRLATFQEKALKTKKKIKSAMVYPAVVITVAVGIVVLLMIVVVPSFQGIFDSMLKGAPLPWLTQFVVDISNFLKENIIAFILLVGGGIFGLSYAGQVQVGKAVIDSLSLKLPKIGDLATKAVISRFTRTFGTLMSSGVPILEALNITREIVGNGIYEKAIDRIHNAVRDGEQLSVQMDRESVFPTMVTSMVDVGEETGDLAEMLNRIADNYDKDLDNAVDAVTSIIEPIMIVFLAVVVGFIVIALFLPIVEIIRTLAG
ncbi:MAG: type II secretion system F family protein [Opitutales bacterium]|nr:type II secretion system F family protein [Opitutales bacterium]